MTTNDNTPPLWSAADFISGTGGVFKGQTMSPVTGVSIDSRTIKPGEAYVAIKGDVHDGHNFCAAALNAGASCALVDRAWAQANGTLGGPLVVVDDALDGLRSLARAARNRVKAGIVGVTGSVGKTGTKEALRLALSVSGKTHSSVKSFNNHWGVPLTLSRMPDDVDFGVFEIGMNHAGEITPLTRLVRPNVAIVTTVEAVHIEFFDSVAGIADAKAEIFLGVTPGGSAVINRDNAYCNQLIGRAETAGVSRIVTFGHAHDADVRLVDVDADAEGSTVTADLLGTRLNYRLGAPGDHWVMNSLAVAGALDALGADVGAGMTALTEIAAPVGRGETHRLGDFDRPLILIDESYNANPASMRAALKVLGSASTVEGGRRIAVLGDMLELGVQSAALHVELSQPIAEAGVDKVFSCGPHSLLLHEGLPTGKQGAHRATSEELTPVVLEDLQPGDVVMVKGSLGSRMGPLVEAIKSRYAPATAP